LAPGGPFRKDETNALFQDSTQPSFTYDIHNRDLIDIFQVQPDGLTTGPTTQMSSGKTPFGFTFGPGNSVVVTEAQRRFPMKATSSSYLLTDGDGLTPVSRVVPSQQTAACWVVVTGETAWVVNTGTSTISSYGIGSDGKLTLRNAVAASSGANTAPIDLAAAPEGTFIYILESAVGTLAESTHIGQFILD
jgi:6-phosphogluconolactonase